MASLRGGARAAAALIALALACTLAACGGGGGDDNANQLKVGYAYGFGVSNNADRVAFDRLQRDTGITPDIIETGGNEQAIAALTKGQVDLAKVSFTAALAAIAQGADIRVILTTNPTLDLILASTPPINSLADVRGERVLLDRPGPSPSVAATKLVLGGAGLSEGDYEIGYLPDSQNRIVALENGRAKVASVESADLVLAQGKADLNQLANVGAQVPPPTTVLVARSDSTKDDASRLNKEVSALLAGYESVYTPAGRAAWIAKARENELKDQPADVANRIYDIERANRYWVRGGPPTQADYQRTLSFLLGNHVIDNSVPFDQVWDTSFWANAASSQKAAPAG
jgi:ABC-type nitrate/sulfonate/bicarbonate transport system substrate-binding protein